VTMAWSRDLKEYREGAAGMRCKGPRGRSTMEPKGQALPTTNQRGQVLKLGSCEPVRGKMMSEVSATGFQSLPSSVLQMMESMP